MLRQTEEFALLVCLVYFLDSFTAILARMQLLHMGWVVLYVDCEGVESFGSSHFLGTLHINNS
mgnify:CR=1 FL=1